MALIGNMGEFSEENEDWMQYIERLQFFFMANGIVQEEQKRAILLTVIGPATFRLLKTLVAPRKVGEESFDNLVADMKNHLNPELSEIIQRYKFNSRVRQAHESVAIFNAQLCKLAEHCNFGPVLEDMLRDRLLSGVNDESIQRRLLLERGLTYRRALEIAMEVESLMRDRRQLHHGAMASAWSLHHGTLETVPGNLTQLPNEEQRLQKVKSERSVFVTTAKSPFESVPGDFENEEPSVCVNECDSTISPDLCELQVVKVEPKEWESWTEQGKLQDVKSESEDSVHARQGMHRKTVELKQDHGWKLSGYEEAPVVDFEKTVEIENSPVVTFGCQQSCNFSEVGKHCGIKFVCSICLVAFSSEDSLAAHEVTHLRENPHKCDVCLKIFNNRQDLLQHQQVHTGEKPFSCEDCGKAFRRKSSLVYHCWSHTEEKPFKCPDCGKGFIAKSQFDQHVRAHKGEKLYACEICGKDFGKKSGLEQHRMVHTGERPFGCNECGRMFRQKRALMVHIRTHTGEKPFDCPICEKAFARKDHLEKHLHVHGETAIRLYESVGSATRSSTAGLLGV